MKYVSAKEVLLVARHTGAAHLRGKAARSSHADGGKRDRRTMSVAWLLS